MDRITSWTAPRILRLFVNECISTLKIGRELQKGIILILDVRPCDPLLDDRLAPILVIEPWLSNLFLRC